MLWPHSGPTIPLPRHVVPTRNQGRCSHCWRWTYGPPCCSRSRAGGGQRQDRRSTVRTITSPMMIAQIYSWQNFCATRKPRVSTCILTDCCPCLQTNSRRCGAGGWHTTTYHRSSSELWVGRPIASRGESDAYVRECPGCICASIILISCCTGVLRPRARRRYRT